MIEGGTGGLHLFRGEDIVDQRQAVVDELPDMCLRDVHGTVLFSRDQWLLSG